MNYTYLYLLYGWVALWCLKLPCFLDEICQSLSDMAFFRRFACLGFTISSSCKREFIQLDWSFNGLVCLPHSNFNWFISQQGNKHARVTISSPHFKTNLYLEVPSYGNQSRIDHFVSNSLQTWYSDFFLKWTLASKNFFLITRNKH